MTTSIISSGNTSATSQFDQHVMNYAAKRIAEFLRNGALEVPAQRVDPGTPAPYEPGERVQVFVGFHKRTGDVYYMWHDGVIMSCHQPDGARRFVCTVSLATSTHNCYVTSRVYCNADGRGEEIRPLIDAMMEELED